jgi:hypothetical protein
MFGCRASSAPIPSEFSNFSQRISSIYINVASLEETRFPCGNLSRRESSLRIREHGREHGSIDRSREKRGGGGAENRVTALRSPANRYSERLQACSTPLRVHVRARTRTYVSRVRITHECTHEAIRQL